jgi:uncharacterized protein YbcC (UPF0753/DUF2309 family)
MTDSMHKDAKKTSSGTSARDAGHTPALREAIERALHHATHLLPAQGPIGVFIHHNTLHAFQHLPFETAVLEASRIYGTEPYMTEEAYRRELRRGRIRKEDIDSVLAAEPNREILGGRLDRRTMRRAMLLCPESPSENGMMVWNLEEERNLFPGAASLFEVALRRTQELDVESSGDDRQRPVRPRDGILTATGIDLDDAVHPLLIRLSGAFLDQGLAYWPMPGREAGFFVASLRLLSQPGGFYGEHLQGLAGEARRHLQKGWSAEESLEDSFPFFGVALDQVEPLVRAELMALRGWAGMFHRLEAEPQLAPHTRLSSRLIDFLAVRMLLNRVAATNAAGSDVSLWSRAATSARPDPLRHAIPVFDAARALELPHTELASLSSEEFAEFAEEAFAFHSIERRRVLHLAYERRHERQVLLPLRAHRRSQIAAERPHREPRRPLAQVFFCIDEREESIRRALEEIEPRIETLGAAGFFGVAIDYAGIEDGHSVPLCPVVVNPQHAVRETVAEGHGDAWERWRAMRRLWAKLAWGSYIGSRSLLRGWFATASLGIFSLFPLIVRILTPRQYSSLRRALNDVLIPRPETELAFTREKDETLDGLQRGFTIQEKADRVAGVLGGAGLVSGFARIVLVLGHGSTSLNNPHESAHDCGACGGRRGGPNARLFAAMANHPEVRAELASRGLVIPEDTWFIGGYHDTCSDDVDLYDLGQLPEALREQFAEVESALHRARARNALERARRFEFADRCSDPEQALQHVEERSEHLAEPRPEYGHCTNAVCIVGRRSSSRGLFLDRRAFLVSYDASQDPTDEFLARQLAAVVPVCAGISLEYYFSFVDNEGYGCGTKLPHNVTGLLGVMNGHASDLRTGLPWQMVEIHEPVRILFVVETQWPRLLATIEANPAVREVVRNRWIRVAAMDPSTGQIHVFRDGEFLPLEGELEEMPSARSSLEWFRGRMDHLPLARIVGDEDFRR